MNFLSIVTTLFIAVLILGCTLKESNNEINKSTDSLSVSAVEIPSDTAVVEFIQKEASSSADTIENSQSEDIKVFTADEEILVYPFYEAQLIKNTNSNAPLKKGQFCSFDRCLSMERTSGFFGY